MTTGAGRESLVDLAALLDVPFSLILVVLVLLDVIFVFVILFVERDNPTRVLHWLLILIYEPFLGVILFLFFHQDYRRKRRQFEKKARALGLSSRIAASCGGSPDGRTETESLRGTAHK